MPPRFYLARPIGADEAVVVLDREESHHLVRALRLGAGDEARVFDSTGAEFRVIVERASARGAEVRVAQRLVALRPEQRRLTLAVSLIRNEPMSWLVQKATELGVERLQPFVSERTTAAKAEEVSSTHSPQAESSEARRRRWERVSLAACKQSGRARPIAVGATMRFERLVGELAAAPLAILAWEGGEAEPLGEILARRLSGLAPDAMAALVIGPEGGFADREYEAAREAGLVPANLGPHILRAETAALAGAAMILGWPKSMESRLQAVR